jgi:hypothetical protein
MNAEVEQSWLQPGDKVVCIDDRFSRSDFYLFSKLPRSYNGVYSVRGTGVHPITGVQVVSLAGIYGIPVDSIKEPAFAASRFKRVSKTSLPQPVPADDLIQIPVRVTSSLAHQLEGLALFPLVETIHEWDDEASLEKVCKRWGKKWKQFPPLQCDSAEVKRQNAEAQAEPLMVPVSPLGAENLVGVCVRLGIELEDWLQGSLRHLARRHQNRREAYLAALRNEARRDQKKNRKN